MSGHSNVVIRRDVDKVVSRRRRSRKGKRPPVDAQPKNKEMAVDAQPRNKEMAVDAQPKNKEMASDWLEELRSGVEHPRVDWRRLEDSKDGKGAFDQRDPHELIGAILKSMYWNESESSEEDIDSLMLDETTMFIGVIRMVRRGDIDRALAKLDEAKKAGVKESKVHYLRATAYTMEGRLEEALKCVVEYNECVKPSEWRPDLQADLLYRLGDRDSLVDLLETWMDIDHRRIDMHVNRARVLSMRGRLVEALSMAESILRLEPVQLTARTLRGDILAKQKRYTEAILAYNEAIRTDFNEVVPHIRKAEVLMEMGRPRDAILACNRVLATPIRSPQLLKMKNDAQCALKEAS